MRRITIVVITLLAAGCGGSGSHEKHVALKPLEACLNQRFSKVASVESSRDPGTHMSWAQDELKPWADVASYSQNLGTPTWEIRIVLDGTDNEAKADTAIGNTWAVGNATILAFPASRDQMSQARQCAERSLR